MEKVKNKRKHLLLPVYLVDIIRFVFFYRAMRIYDRLKIIRNILIKWLAIMYIPVTLWIFFSLFSNYWGLKIGFVEQIMPFLIFDYLPVPLFYPITDNIMVWLMIGLIDIVILMFSQIVMNMLVIKEINYERIEEKWRRCCLHIGLTTNTNLQPESDVKEYPHVITVKPGSFIIKSKGITPDRIQEKKTEISAAMGVFIGDVRFLERADGATYSDLLELTYSYHDLPAQIPLQTIPAFNNGHIVFGLSMDGWYVLNLERIVHMGVSGETGSGKSVFLRCFIAQLLVTDRDAIIIGIDFKGGVEFDFFSELGNFISIEEYVKSSKAMAIINKEYVKRVQLIKRNNCESIYELKNRKNIYVPPIVVMIDEATEFFGAKKAAKREMETAINLIDKLIRLGRFVGIHMIVCTQRASADVMPTQIRSMLVTRVIFRVTQKEDSIMFIGTGAASKLRKIPGRFYVRAADGILKELQSPYISKEDVKKILRNFPKPVENQLVSALRNIRTVPENVLPVNLRDEFIQNTNEKVHAQG